MRRIFRLNLCLMTALSLSFFSQQATAEINDPSGKITIELNAQQQVGENCRLNFVIKNGLKAKIEDLTLELVLFDQKSQISNILTTKSGTLPIGKTRVKRYALKDTNCSEISKILINDVKSCTGTNLTTDTCLDALSPTSRTDSKLEL